MDKRLFVIGDIHGCLDELKFLLRTIESKLMPEDEIVFVGDYIDRGPNSKGVIDLLIYRQKNHPNKHIFLRGNHEDLMMNDLSLSCWMRNGGVETAKSYGINLTYNSSFTFIWSLDLPQDHVKFYQETQFAYQCGRVVCVHAGLNPLMSLEDHDAHDMMWTRRFVGYAGDYKNNYFVVYGHTPLDKVKEEHNQLGIDTACVFGGLLSCAILEPTSGVVLDIIKEKSTFDYRSGY